MGISTSCSDRSILQRMHVAGTKRSIRGWLRAAVWLTLAAGPLGCAHRLDKARWWTGTVPGVCKVFLEPEGTELSYDASGRLLSAVTPDLDEDPPYSWSRGDWERFSYDAQGRLTEIHAGKQYSEMDYTPDDNTYRFGVREVLDLRFAYDAEGRLVSKEEVKNTYHRGLFHSADWTLAKIDPSRREVMNYTYDSAGRFVRGGNGGFTFGWTYDEGGRLALIWSHVDSRFIQDSARTSLTYDALGRVVGLRKEACTPSSGCQLASTSRYTYDDAGRLVEDFQEEPKPSSRIHTRIRWEYPPAWEPPSFERSRVETFDWGKTVTQPSRRYQLTYKKGRLARITGNRAIEVIYQGACENVRLAEERLFAPDVLGSLLPAPCITSPMGYYSTCVQQW